MLREARPADADAVARVLQDARATAMPWLAVVHDADDVRDFVGRVLLPTRRVVVADEDGDVVAFCAVHGACVEQLYVAPHAQGRGLGRALLDDAKSGAARLELHVFARNARARRFYAAAGFVEVAHGDGTGNEEHEPDVLLAWDDAADARRGTLPA